MILWEQVEAAELDEMWSLVMDKTCCTQNKHAHHRHPTPCSVLISGLHHKFCPLPRFLGNLMLLKQALLLFHQSSALFDCDEIDERHKKDDCGN